MKIKAILSAIFSLLVMGGAIAQGVEYDDMYFNGEDRSKLRAERANDVVYNSPAESRDFDSYDENENFNPSDSYSARNVNPEYTSRAHTQSAQAEEADYFVNNYQYNANQLNNWNNNYSQWHNNSWYRPNFYGPGINSWNSPYYGYDSWNSPWYDPYWAHNGWSSSFSFHFGNSWNYGWGGRYNYWNRPYYGWDPYGMAYGYGMGYGGGYWNNYRYPSTIVIVNDGERGGRDVVYGKRPSRGTSVVSERNAVRSRSSNAVRTTNSRSESNSGRVSTSNTKQADYYRRYNQAQRSSSGSSFNNRQSTNNNRSSSWSNSSNNNTRSYTPPSSGRTSSPSYSTPSRSSGSGTNGRSRGRN